MRAGLSTIQQTLTPEAASVLSQSIGEAGRRNHSQTTPLHVAATLLASPSGYLRQACIRSHPNSSHPLQCRALELCFSVALDRLPSAQNVSSSSTSLEPPISNALMAALKRAQAHQRRGCPEQQQQPLLAVKVELEQLIISILDDPSVSRVMREASFSSPAVKATIEQLLNSSTTNSASSVSPSPGIGLGFRSNSQGLNRNLYLNPRLQQGNLNSDHFVQSRREEVSKVIDILLKSKKKNPVLVGDREPELMVKDLLQRIEKREMVETSLRNVQIIHLEKELGSDRSQMLAKIKELGGVIDGRISSGGVILNLGDLKWLVEQPQGISPIDSSPQMLTEIGKAIVVEMSKLLARFGEGNGKLWLIGTASCETYLRCQVYHPTMENDWDLQAVPITAKAPLPGMFPRVGGNGMMSGSVDFFMPLKGFSIAHPTLLRRSSENIDTAQRTKCCPLCTQGYEQELAKLVLKESEKTPEAKQEPTGQPLPQWLQMAKTSNGNAKATDQSQTNDQEVMITQKTEELQKKWNETCSRLHPRFHQNLSSERIAPAALSMMSPFNSNPLGRQAFQPKLQLTKNLSGPIQMTPNAASQLPLQRVLTPPGSPVRTDLALGHEKASETTQKEQPIRDYITAEPQDRFSESNREKLASILDPDSFKSLLKGLGDKVWWQKEAASAVAANVIQCRSGNNRRQGLGLKGDTWLLFAGPDRVGKKKMAMALSELICRSSPITIRLGSRGNDDDDLDVSFRGKTTLDRIAEAVQRNPSSVIVLEDIDQADMLVHGSIKRAIERGRLPDSHGREVSLKNAIFILTAKGLPENLKDEPNFVAVREEKIANSVSKSWQLQLSFIEKSVKRRPDWLIQEENRVTKSRTEVTSGFSFDLNEAASVEDDAGEGSRNSSDLTFEHDQEHGQTNSQSLSTPIPRELVSSVDEAIVFKPVDFGPIQSKVASTIVSKFTNIIDDGRLIEVDSEALDRIVGGVWFGGTELDDWVEKVLVPSFHRLKNALKTAENSNKNVKLISVTESERRSSIEWLPSKITLSTADVLSIGVG